MQIPVNLCSDVLAADGEYGNDLKRIINIWQITQGILHISIWEIHFIMSHRAFEPR